MIRAFGVDEILLLIEGAKWTIFLSLSAFAGGAVGGALTALLGSGANTLARWSVRIFFRIVQGTPLLMQLFLIFFGLGAYGIDLDPWLAAFIGLTLNSSAFLGDIWRGCIEAVPKGQTEASHALGLGYVDRMLSVILPQAATLAYAPTVGFSVQLVKATSLAAILGFTELTRAGQIANNATFQPFLVFSIVAAIYFILCWPLSLLCEKLEQRSQRVSL